MFCEPYRQSLTEAACSGEMLRRELELHVEECPACRAALAEEQELFRSIDSALWASANGPVPASLVSEVQAGIVREPTMWSWRMPVLTFAWAMVLVVVAGLLMLNRHGGRTTPVVRGTNSPEIEASTRLEPEPHAASPGTALAGAQRRAVAADQPVKGIEPEVIVSPEEQAGLKRYEALLRSRHGEQTAAAMTAQETREIKPLEIAGIDVKELAIQPLDLTDSN